MKRFETKQEIVDYLDEKSTGRIKSHQPPGSVWKPARLFNTSLIKPFSRSPEEMAKGIKAIENRQNDQRKHLVLPMILGQIRVYKGNQ